MIPRLSLYNSPEKKKVSLFCSYVPVILQLFTMNINYNEEKKSRKLQRRIAGKRVDPSQEMGITGMRELQRSGKPKKSELRL
jgi:hypothetical protein